MSDETFWERRAEVLEAQVQSLSMALQDSYLEALEDVYSRQHFKDGKWSHMCMSDGEWLAGLCGFDRKAGWYPTDGMPYLITQAAHGMVHDKLNASLVAEGPEQ